MVTFNVKMEGHASTTSQFFFLIYYLFYEFHPTNHKVHNIHPIIDCYVNSDHKTHQSI